MEESTLKTFECRDERCVSELTLDRYAREEVDAAERLAIEGVLAECEGCQARLQAAQAGFSGLEGANRDGMLAAIRGAVQEDEIPSEIREAFSGRSARNSRREETSSRSLRQRFLAWWSAQSPPRLATLAVPLLALAVILPISLSDPEAPTDPLSPGTRIKGAIQFRVYRIEDGERVLKMSGDRFAAGDELAYELSLVKDAHVLIVGVEADGKRYASYPPNAEGHSMSLRRGAEQLMSQTVILESLDATEWLHAIACDRPFRLSAITHDLDTGKLRLPPGCSQSGFKMVKKEP